MQTLSPLVPAQAGTQLSNSGALGPWVPAYAGTNGGETSDSKKKGAPQVQRAFSIPECEAAYFTFTRSMNFANASICCFTRSSVV